jgi:uncharacterized protein YqeY
MSMLETLKTQLTQCRRAGKPIEMGVLQVVLGDASMIEARTGKKASDEDVEKLIRKTMLGNQETLGLLEQKGMTGNANHEKLTAENAFLQSLLPQTLSASEIVGQLGEVADALRAAKNDGQATGIAMKHLKGKGLRVLGEDVSAAVKMIRGA